MSNVTGLFRKGHTKTKHGQWLIISPLFEGLKGSDGFLKKEYHKNFIQRFIFNVEHWYIPTLIHIFKYRNKW